MLTFAAERTIEGVLPVAAAASAAVIFSADFAHKRVLPVRAGMGAGPLKALIPLL